MVAHTVKGKGVSFMENDPEWHGKAPSRRRRSPPSEVLGVTERLGGYLKTDSATRAIVDELTALEKK